MTAIYFVIEKSLMGGEQPVLYHDYLPPKARRVYALRLDTLPLADRWTAMSLPELAERYYRLRDAKALPASNIAPPAMAKSAPAKILVGERYKSFSRPWAGQPGQPLPTVASLDARAAIRQQRGTAARR